MEVVLRTLLHQRSSDLPLDYRVFASLDSCPEPDHFTRERDLQPFLGFLKRGEHIVEHHPFIISSWNVPEVSEEASREVQGDGAHEEAL